MTTDGAAGIDASIPTVSPDDDLRRVAALFLEHGTPALRCVDAAGRAVGAVTRDAVSARLAIEDAR
jgi:CBS domain-containing protein